MIVCVVTTASLGWVPNSGQDHQFWYLMAIVYNQISDHQRLKLYLSKDFTALSSLIIIIILLLHILCSIISSYLLVLDHFMLKLNKSHNIKRTQEVTTKLLYFVQVMGAKSCVTLFE